MSGIFISYSRKDAEFARRLATSLEQMGTDVWIDVDDIPSGLKWSTAIQQGLDNAEIMLVVLSPDSMASTNVEDEWQYFIDSKKPIIPILLREAKIHFQLNRIQWVDFLHKPYERALNDLHQELSQKGLDIRKPADVTAVAYSRSDVQRYAKSVQGQKQKNTQLPIQLIAGISVGALAMLAVMAVLFFAARNRTNQDANATLIAQNEIIIAATSTIMVQNDQILNGTYTPIPTLAPTQTPTDEPFVIAPVESNLEWNMIERNINGVDMVLVPPGTFILGATDTQLSDNRANCARVLNDCSMLNDEQPHATVMIENAFWIDKTEVTNAIYANGSGDNLPKTNVDWQEAAAHCTGREARLPSEVEWEYAASGVDNWNYAWGNTWDAAQPLANICDSNCDSGWRDAYRNDGYAGVAPVGSFPNGASWVGALDMGGNVWEYTASVYAAYPYNANNANSSVARTLRGGAYVWIQGEATTSARATGIAAKTEFYGFRCVRDYHDGDLERFP